MTNASTSTMPTAEDRHTRRFLTAIAFVIVAPLVGWGVVAFCAAHAFSGPGAALWLGISGGFLLSLAPFLLTRTLVSASDFSASSRQIRQSWIATGHGGERLTRHRGYAMLAARVLTAVMPVVVMGFGWDHVSLFLVPYTALVAMSWMAYRRHGRDAIAAQREQEQLQDEWTNIFCRILGVSARALAEESWINWAGDEIELSPIPVSARIPDAGEIDSRLAQMGVRYEISDLTPHTISLRPLSEESVEARRLAADSGGLIIGLTPVDDVQQQPAYAAASATEDPWVTGSTANPFATESDPQPYPTTASTPQASTPAYAHLIGDPSRFADGQQQGNPFAE
jgi:hypothetical protein